MTTSKPLVTMKSLELDNDADFDDIKKRIESYPIYAGLKKLCCFHLEEKRIDYLTESIHPNREKKDRDRIPVLFLFSNPHPDSVSRCLFFSEPHSRAFWERLSESDYFKKDVKLMKKWVKNWDDSTTPKEIAQFMLQGKYENPFLLYFHCLWSIPTKKPEHLKSLFKGNRQLWEEKVNGVGKEELRRLVEDQKIKHIIVFPAPIFYEITRVRALEVKEWQRSVMRADCFSGNKEKDREKYWATRPYPYVAKAKLPNGVNDVDVYLAFDTHAKNWGKAIGKETGKRYFMWVIDMILMRAEDSTKSDVPKAGNSVLQRREDKLTDRISNLDYSDLQELIETVHYDQEVPPEPPGETLDDGDEDTEEDD